MNTDGNTAAIDRHLAEQEAYDAANPDDMYCPACDEVINGPDCADFIADETCPDCAGQLEETP